MAAVLLLAACDDSTTAPTRQQDHAAAIGAASMYNAAVSDLLKDLRRATARYHSTEQALAAGYIATEHCVAGPLGGMGMHYGNPVLVNDGVFDPLRPEVLLYEPTPNGRPKLVAVEYVLLNTGQEHPAFDGHLFDEGGTPNPLPHWSLHVWLYKENPNGIFTPYNPDVSCN